MAHMVWVCVSSTQWLVILAAPAVRKVCASKKVQELGYMVSGLGFASYMVWGLGFRIFMLGKEQNVYLPRHGIP